jgi:hypothetical protein
MSEGLGGHVTKGRVHLLFDRYVNEQKAKRKALLDGLRAADTPDKYVGILRDVVGVKAAQTRYLTDTWYNTGAGGLWSKLQPIYPILRRGLIKALEEAGDTLPLESYWTTTGTQVEVMVMRSAHQVTRVIVTPPGDPAVDARTSVVPMWVIRRPVTGEPRTTTDEVMDLVEPGVIISQMKEWEPPQ